VSNSVVVTQVIGGWLSLSGIHEGDTELKEIPPQVTNEIY